MGSYIPKNLVPVTVIAGYLGAGKTTIINELLAHDHGRRLAVLVNDFGAVNIDAALIAGGDTQTISLKNGCVCCSIADELGDALDRVVALAPPPDQIVIEASGVADPANVAAYGQGWPGCRLDAVIVLADAETVRERSRDQFVGELVTRQLRRADLAVVTKCDLVTDADLAGVMGWMAGVVGGAPVLTRCAGQMDPALLLEAGHVVEAVSPPPPPASSTVDADSFESVLLEVGAALDREQVESALRSWPPSVLRVKGVVRLDGDPGGIHIVHRVGRRWSIERASGLLDQSRAGQLVLIGRRGTLNRCDITASLLGCPPLSGPPLQQAGPPCR